jgi:hypothetical protein
VFFSKCKTFVQGDPINMLFDNGVDFFESLFSAESSGLASLTQPVEYDEYGKKVAAGNDSFWTGWLGQTGSTCNKWSVVDGFGIVGRSPPASLFASKESVGCEQSHRLLCLQTPIYAAQAPPSIHESIVMYLSPALFQAGDMGSARNADGYCESAAGSSAELSERIRQANGVRFNRLCVSVAHRLVSWQTSITLHGFLIQL